MIVYDYGVIGYITSRLNHTRIIDIRYSFDNRSILSFCSQRTGPSYRSGPAFCPTLNATDSQEILVSSGVKKVIRVKVHIIGVSDVSGS